MSDARYGYPPLALPAGVRICQTERGGHGWGFNLAGHVGAPDAEVRAHRMALQAAHCDIKRIQWLTQVHGTSVVRASAEPDVKADAVWTSEPGVACAVMTADCLPILLWADDGSVVAAVHAGWRGLAAGIIENTVKNLPTPPDGLGAWLGPRIGPRSFEVGPEVRDVFVGGDASAALAFVDSPRRPGHYLADLGMLARQRLSHLGVASVVDSEACTMTETQRWFSFRREARCGRMASLIWRQ